MRLKKLLLLATLIAALTVPTFAGVRLGGVGIGFGYTHFSGPYCCYYPYIFDAFYYGAGYYGPWYPLSFYQPGPTKGLVRLKNVENTAEIYIDQAYAGVAKDLKNIYLDPGAYDLEVRSPGKVPVQKRVYVLSGKTVKLEF